MKGALAILDWGIGGVGVLTELRRRSCGQRFIYFSDAGYTPYGLLSRRELERRLDAVTAYLIASGVGGIVVACNAASTVLSALQLRLDVPAWGVLDSALELVPATVDGTLGVIGGRRTIRSRIYSRNLAAPGRRIVQRIAQPLSAHIEAGTARTAECARELDRILKPLRGAKAVLLACTHYPAISDLIAERLPGSLLLDPAEALAETVSRGWLPEDAPAQRVLTTGDPRTMRSAALRAWNLDLGEIEAVSAPTLPPSGDATRLRLRPTKTPPRRATRDR